MDAPPRPSGLNRLLRITEIIGYTAAVWTLAWAFLVLIGHDRAGRFGRVGTLILLVLLGLGNLTMERFATKRLEQVRHPDEIRKHYRARLELQNIMRSTGDDTAAIEGFITKLDEEREMTIRINSAMSHALRGTLIVWPALIMVVIYRLAENW